MSKIGLEMSHYFCVCLNTECKALKKRTGSS